MMFRQVASMYHQPFETVLFAIAQAAGLTPEFLPISLCSSACSTCSCGGGRTARQ